MLIQVISSTTREGRFSERTAHWVIQSLRTREDFDVEAVEFEMSPLRHAVHILPDIMIAARQAGDVSDATAFGPLEPKLKLLADDLSWWAEALSAARAHEQR